jgi:hypothetical protein
MTEYVGKYKDKYTSIEALEDAIGASTSEALKIKNELDTTKAQLANYTTPDSYSVPADLKLEAKDTEVLVGWAKEGGLSQSQFNKLAAKAAAGAKELTAKQANEKAVADKAHAEALGKYDKNELDSLSRFVKDEFGDAADPLLGAITKPEVFSKLKEVKIKMTNNSLPGMNGAIPTVGANDINALPEIQKQLADLHQKLDIDPQNSAAHREQILSLTKRKMEIQNNAKQQKTA